MYACYCYSDSMRTHKKLSHTNYMYDACAPANKPPINPPTEYVRARLGVPDCGASHTNTQSTRIRVALKCAHRMPAHTVFTESLAGMHDRRI